MIRASFAVLFASTTFAVAATPDAQDIHLTDPSPLVLPAPPSPFEGGYLGGQLGYIEGSFGTGLLEIDGGGAFGGIHAGYLHGFGNGWFGGAELQYDVSDLDVSSAALGGTAELRDTVRAKLIAGYQIGDGLLFGTVGAAYGDFDGPGTAFDGGEAGYVIGLGYDHALSDSLTVGAEYLHQRFDDVGPGGSDLRADTLQIRASFRF